MLVLVHGMGHWTQAAWDRLAARFATTHRIVAYDLPGFGVSERPRRKLDLAFFTETLEDVVGHAGAERFVLAGHSLGGLIAANHAAAHADRLAALVLLDPAGFLRTPGVVLRVAGSRPATWLMGTLRPSRGFIERTLDTSVFDRQSVTPEIRERAYWLSQDSALTHAFACVYRDAMRDLLRMRALHARFAAWRGPTLLVWGKQDRYIPFRALASARRVYPEAAVLAIDRCGHCPQVEYPDLVAAAITNLPS